MKRFEQELVIDTEKTFEENVKNAKEVVEKMFVEVKAIMEKDGKEVSDETHNKKLAEAMAAATEKIKHTFICKEIKDAIDPVLKKYGVNVSACTMNWGDGNHSQVNYVKKEIEDAIGGCLGDQLINSLLQSALDN